MHARRYPLIFNPKARSQNGSKMMKFLMKHGGKFVMYATRYAGEARELAAHLAQQGEPIVIAAGGDGTLNEVVQGLAGSNTTLGILPVGTMNVFARELKIPINALDEALQIIEHGHSREIDLFTVNQHAFIQMAGVGFDAEVIEATKWEMKKSLGPLAYLLSFIKVLGTPPPALQVHFPDGSSLPAVAVLVGNGSFYGGPFRFFHEAKNDDGLMDLIIFQEAGYQLLMASLRGLALGGIDLGKSTLTLQAKSFKITSSSSVPIEVDGEWLGRFQDIEFQKSSHALRVFAPLLSAPAETSPILNLAPNQPFHPQPAISTSVKPS